MTTVKKVYISGKIGEEKISDATREKFAKAEEMLKAKGFDTFNPTNQEWQEHLRKKFPIDREEQPNGERVSFYSYCLLRDLMVLATCTHVYMLYDWRQSPGAHTECAYAMACDKKMLFGERLHAQTYLEEILKDSWRDCRPLTLPDDGESDYDCVQRFVKKHLDEVWLPL